MKYDSEAEESCTSNMSPVEEKENLCSAEEIPLSNEFFKPDEEILSACDDVSRGNSSSTDLISAQPQSASAGPAEDSQQMDTFKKPQLNFNKPRCTQCSLPVSEQIPCPDPQSLSRTQGSNSSMYSGGSRKREGSMAGSRRTTPTLADSCFHLLMACLWCECSMLLLGLMEACSFCLQGLCSSCCRVCALCCSAVQDIPVEELNCNVHCHSVLFESCCEPTECLEFCLECCEICHRS